MRLFAPHISPIEDLIKRYHKPLYWHIRRMVVCHDDAQDVLQNTFLQVHLHLSELKDKQQERAWVYKVATNEALQWLRSKREFISLEDEDASALLSTLHAETNLDTADSLLVLFQQAILTLPTMQRAVFNLRYYDELSYDEIAQIIGSSSASAKTNYHYAKEKVSNYMLKHS